MHTIPYGCGSGRFFRQDEDQLPVLSACVARSSGYAALDLVNERRTNLPINDRTAAEEWAMNFARNKPFPGVNPAWTNIGM